MEELLRNWDGEKAVIRFDHESGAWIFIAIHDRTLGTMASGGCRMKVYDQPRDGLHDALRLARGMTYKWAAIDFPFGGGKAVIAVPHPLEADVREGVLLRVGDLIESLGGTYGTGEDMGTTPADMDVIARRTSRVFGRTPEQGGSGDPGRWTALGVFESIRAACGHAFDTDTLDGRTVLIQGVGSVGAPLGRMLADAGATVLASDALPDRARAVARDLGGEPVAPQDAYDTPCDVFAPCAVGGVLNARSIPRLRCRIVAGSANNQLETEEDDARLREHDILYAPDFVVNAGGAIALSGFEVLGWDEDRVEERTRGIGETLGRILEEAARRDGSPLEEARLRAQRVLDEARRGTPSGRSGYRTSEEDERVPAT